MGWTTARCRSDGNGEVLIELQAAQPGEARLGAQVVNTDAKTSRLIDDIPQMGARAPPDPLGN